MYVYVFFFTFSSFYSLMGYLIFSFILKILQSNFLLFCQKKIIYISYTFFRKLSNDREISQKRQEGGANKRIVVWGGPKSYYTKPMPITTFIFWATNLRSKNVKFNVFFLTDGREKRKRKIKVEGKRWLVKKEKKRIKRWFCHDETTLYGKIFSDTLLLIPYCVSHVHLSTSFCRNLNIKSLSYLWVIGTWINGSNINFWIRPYL